MIKIKRLKLVNGRKLEIYDIVCIRCNCLFCRATVDGVFVSLLQASLVPSSNKANSTFSFWCCCEHIELQRLHWIFAYLEKEILKQWIMWSIQVDGPWIMRWRAKKQPRDIDKHDHISKLSGPHSSRWRSAFEASTSITKTKNNSSIFH